MNLELAVLILKLFTQKKIIRFVLYENKISESIALYIYIIYTIDCPLACISLVWKIFP